MLGPDDPPLLKIAQLKIFVNNLSDFANFGELKKKKISVGRQALNKSMAPVSKTLDTPLLPRPQAPHQTPPQDSLAE